MAMDAQISAFQERLAGLDTEVGQLSLGAGNLDDFFRVFLEKCVAVLGVGGGVWRVTELGDTEPQCHLNLNPAGMEDGGYQCELLASALQRVVSSVQPVVLPANDGANVYDGGLGPAGENRCQHTLLFAPIIEGDRVGAVLLLIAPTDVDPRAVRGYAGYVMGLCQKASGFLHRYRITQLELKLRRQARWREYVSSLHSCLDPRRACYALANFGQEILAVYRCMVGTFTVSGRFHVESVSGLETVSTKSAMMQDIATVARAACRHDRTLLVDNPSAAQSTVDDSADDLITASRLYMLQAESKYMGIFPIHHENRVVGALIVEKATEEPIDQDQRERIDALVSEAGVALTNCMAYRHLPLAPLMRAAAAVRNKIMSLPTVRRAVWLTLFAALIVLPFVIQKDIKVVGTAELQPVSARAAYARQQGVIDTVMAGEKMVVAAGDILMTLDTRTIDREIDAVQNQYDEVSIACDEQIRRNGLDSPAAQQLTSQLQVLDARLKKLQQDRAEHEVRAPVAGMVITPDTVLRQLTTRPVQRGEVLIEIVPRDSAWELLVRIPEEDAGNLLRAYDNLEPGQQLAARGILNAHPEIKLDTHVISVSPRARVLSLGDRSYRNVVEVRVAQPEQIGADKQIIPREGMEGKVAITCDSRSVFYAATHEFANFVRVGLF